MTLNGASNGVASAKHEQGYKQQRRPSDLLESFLAQYRELEAHKEGKPVVIDGHTLSVSDVVAAARYGSSVALDESKDVRARVDKSRSVIVGAVEAARSVYGVSTGFGGSADTRTNNHLALGHALVQHHHTGVLPSAARILDVLPLAGDPFSASSMPEAWVRGAILIRVNSLVRGHSAVRWELLERMVDLLQENITPFIPLRGSISASGDLTPLSYIAGAVMGNPSIRVFDGPRSAHARAVVSSADALAAHGLASLPLQAKEHLGIMNGTAFSASVGALVLHDATHLALLAQVLTAMGTEALLGVRANYAPFIHEVARPHPGQVEAARTIWDLLEDSPLAFGHEKEAHISEDAGELRQDRYPLRTAPQFLGPQLEDIIAALNALTVECNSTTDNPLFDGETGTVHHGGNFQAMAVTNAMEKTRLALHHVGKILFAQSTELLNPAMNRGLPPSLAATDPSLNYHAKGLDIATAAYVSELGFLANPVSTNIQSAEMHNQAVNSLALISARMTVTAVDVLSLLSATYLYLLCQALDLRALQAELAAELHTIVHDELRAYFPSLMQAPGASAFEARVLTAMTGALDSTSTMDAVPRMVAVAATSTPLLVSALAGSPLVSEYSLTAFTDFRDTVAARAAFALSDLREQYLSGKRGSAPARRVLNRTRPLYEFVRVTLGISMHGEENRTLFPRSVGGVDEQTIGQNVSLIHEAIRDGKMQSTVAGLFE
ncbi:phenylalanine ammonium lyase [Vararia minispora EC-137]|uniref:Phenylalanine ammonium lyase n=1 Tax=Vararia minispora EC-137 TaxID=1314806 RepID=A0ACB8QSR2_9AGAM|nr:phenylalanine ammonium lyase [Vararia minispora EC-137]